MVDYRAIAMDDDEIDEFLGTEGVGVISLAKGGDSYALPLSYGFDPTTGHFFFRLGFDDASRKAFLAWHRLPGKPSHRRKQRLNPNKACMTGPVATPRQLSRLALCQKGPSCRIRKIYGTVSRRNWMRSAAWTS